jgi:hypothetical protein
LVVNDGYCINIKQKDLATVAAAAPHVKNTQVCICLNPALQLRLFIYVGNGGNARIYFVSGDSGGGLFTSGLLQLIPRSARAGAHYYYYQHILSIINTSDKQIVVY